MMSYAAVMVHVDVDSDLSGRAHLAAGLADRFRARLIGVAGWAPMALFTAEEGADPAPNDLYLQDMNALLDQKGKEFRAAFETPDRRVEWRTGLVLPTELVAREARAADLVVVGNAPEPGGPFRALDPGMLVLKAGRPVLVVPPALSSLPLKRVAIAWKDVREARRAVADALPFLKQAESVMIVEISEGDDWDRALHRVKDVAGYLSRHGIDVVAERVRPAEVGAASSLLRLVHDENVNLLVAGGYGHSRLGEWAFGGVTRELLAESPVCCLLAH